MRREFVALEEEDRQYESLLNKRETWAEGKNLIRIVCVGDSHTFGVGAEPGNSYPAQLQRLLDKEAPNKYRVYNCGVPGNTSSKSLKVLPKLMEKVNPSVVIILLGSNDICNPDFSEISLLSDSSGRYNLRKFFLSLRINKALRLGLNGARNKIKIMLSRRLQLNHSEAKEVNSKSIKYSQMGYNLKAEGKIDMAKDYFWKAIEKDPNNGWAYLQLGHIYVLQSEYEKALTAFRELLKNRPYTKLRRELYRDLFWIYQNPASPRDRINKIIRNIPSDELFQNPGIAFLLDRAVVLSDFKDNIKKMLSIIQSKKAIPILQTYLSSSLTPTDDVLRALAREHNVLLVDSQKNPERWQGFNALFSSDTHPNHNGYYIMAQNLYEAIKGMRSLIED